LDDVEARYGGIDSVLVWQYYPNSGLDDRNNFDMISNLPGGMAGAQEMVAAFQARGVEVLWACFPWDHGTRNTGRPEYVDLVEVCHYMTQPLVELYGGCMVVLKVSWCGIGGDRDRCERHQRRGGGIKSRILP
jgi:hypothetical protein